jgi:hypothetical protein
MNFILSFLTIIISSVIFYQDYKSRQVHFFLFPCLCICGFAINFLTHTVYEVLYYFFINLVLVAFQFCLLYLYFRSKKSRLYDKIGIGDFLCVAALCFFFSTANFLLFYISSQIFALLISFISTNTLKEKFHKTIPLAGLQALVLSFIMLFYVSFDLSLMNDDWIIKILI